MSTTTKFIFILCAGLTMTSCVAKKKFVSLQTQLDTANKDLGKCGESLNAALAKLTTCEKDKENHRSKVKTRKNSRQ